MWNALLLNLGTGLYLAAQAPATTMSADGFVTQAVTGGTLQVGTLTVYMSDKTQCSKDDIEFEERNHNAMVHKIGIPCVTANLSIGSYVHATGVRQRDGSLAAIDVVAGAEFSPIKKRPIGRDKRFEDFFDGGPWRGRLKGGAFLEEAPELTHGSKSMVANLWANGFPLELTRLTDVRIAQHTLTGDLMVRIATNNMAAQIPPFSSTPKSPSLVFPPTDVLRPGIYLSYEGIGKSDGSLEATKLLIFPHTITMEREKLSYSGTAKITKPNYEAHIPGSIQYKHGTAIHIIPDRTVQNYVRNIGMGLLPAFQTSVTSSDPSRINFRFYVVRPFENLRKNQFVQIDGRCPKGAGGPSPFIIPTDHSRVDRVVEMPDGVILIPDTGLARLRNQAQLAFVLSVAVQSIIQRQAYIASVVAKWSATGVSYIGIDYMETQRNLRLSIRQMYLTGYDIREAPFAWEVARGEPVNNPVIDSKNLDKDIPWYTAYAFNYISQYYQDVDYSKLKRGEAEYAQFLQELYKADPSLKHPKAQH